MELGEEDDDGHVQGDGGGGGEHLRVRPSGNRRQPSREFEDLRLKFEARINLKEHPHNFPFKDIWTPFSWSKEEAIAE